MKWAHFLDRTDETDGAGGVIQGETSGSNTLSLAGETTETFYALPCLTIKDNWGQVIRFESHPPYMSYRLWSKGPDKADGTPDDLHRDKWDN